MSKSKNKQKTQNKSDKSKMRSSADNASAKNSHAQVPDNTERRDGPGGE